MEKNIKKMRVDEYASLRGITKSAVTQAINRGNKTPGIVGWEKWGRDFVLYVDENQLVIGKQKKSKKNS